MVRQAHQASNAVIYISAGLFPSDELTHRCPRFDISDSGQQIHIAFGPSGPKSSRHPCFRIASPDALLELRRRVWEHHLKGGDSAPQEADQPGAENSGMFTGPGTSRLFSLLILV